MRNRALCVIVCALLCLAAIPSGTRIIDMTAITTPSTNTWFEVADLSATPKSRKLSLPTIKGLINSTNVNGSGTANTLPKWTGTNSLGSIGNGQGFLANDGTGGFLWTTNVGGISETFIFFTQLVTNNFFLSGKGNTLIVTQYVRFPYTNLTVSGTNVATPDLSAASHFKLTLTTNATMPAPTGLPGTNSAQTIQFAVKQDATGGRTLTWNSAWKFAGGTAPTLTTNAGYVDLFTFVSSPFDATQLYGVPSQDMR